ncbi:MAG: type I restriction-modification system subunit M [Bacteroidota bacterium]
MNHTTYNSIVNFIWGIADDVLRDVYVRGKYRDVILPMTVIRRLDVLLEPTKKLVIDMKKGLDKAKVANQDAALRQAAGQAFYNTSPYTLRDLQARAKQQQLKADFESYLDGFSPNVQEILEKFKFRNQLPTLIEADILGGLIEKYLDSSMNLSPNPILDPDGNVLIPGLDNHSMGTVFEELIRKFNEENNEEAGEHFTPRDVVKLMAKLIFLPIADKIESGTYLLYDGACGTGGMLTVAEETLFEIAKERKKDVSVHLFGQEINPETYAICKADFLLKGEGSEADNIIGGADKSTLSNDAFRSKEFDFMISNPPYGKSWKSDLERMGGKESIKDPRFIIEYAGDAEYNLLTRSSDGQLMFLVNKISKMKHKTSLGSRIAHVHNGSSLFTGDAGQGESNIRRWIIENDWLEAIIALPLNIFYNTGIATYIWVLTNRKPAERKGKVQLIDATEWYQPLRKNLGKKNCQHSEEDIARICDTFLTMKESEQSKVFPNEAFGYWKITVERPLRLKSQFTKQAIETLRYASGDETIRKDVFNRYGQSLYDKFPSIKKELDKYLSGDADTADTDDDTETKKKSVPEKIRKKILDAATWKKDHELLTKAKTLSKFVGDDLFEDYNEFKKMIDSIIEKNELDISQSERKTILKAISERSESCAPIIKKINKEKAVTENSLHGFYRTTIKNEVSIVEYEPDTELRDYEQVPLLENGGITAFFQREVLPYVPDAWIDESKTKIGYEISFTRHFYKPEILRSLEEIKSEILSLEKESEGLLSKILQS